MCIRDRYQRRVRGNRQRAHGQGRFRQASRRLRSQRLQVQRLHVASSDDEAENDDAQGAAWRSGTRTVRVMSDEVPTEHDVPVRTLSGGPHAGDPTAEPTRPY
eukprot:TRINITY_DN1612_c0_g1_i3.p1 TRINITY_DN1612_c0_g1~~TRINITY_DN1612_c0_g1_i3.p1  ORF type:complete len:103 (-),score=10.08 TRINITY_DN1612_c0_g1_i3:130-438(-)